jgi:predicted ATPase
LPQFADGIWITELSAIGDPALLPATIATGTGLHFNAGAITMERVAGALASRELLVVLETCEHVIDAAAEMAEALMRAAPKVRIIATSRETLNAYGEWVYRLRPLPVPGDDETDLADYRSVSLFLARAQATDLSVAKGGYATAVASICRRLDGIPLALELAAARAATLGIYTLADRLDDYLQILTCGRRTALPRHQTLRATFDWSYGLLTHAERAVLRRLAVFPGVFSLDEASAVATGVDVTATAAIEGLANLVAKSLVSTEGVGGVSRYRLLETTRAYAFEKLARSGEFDAATARYSECR